MDRGEEISGFVRKLTDAKSLSHQELLDAVQETLDWLRASPDYRNCIEGNAFSLLPNEIIDDVVDSHGVERISADYELQKLVKIEGSWGAFARELSACTRQEEDDLIFHSREYDPAARSSREKEIPFEEARNRFICESYIDDDHLDLDRLTVLAPKLYDDIYLNELPDTHEKALDLIGTRFATITWRGGDSEEAATLELVNFLRRQLRSKYLRNLEVSGVNFEDGAFDKELVVFVTRPWFEMLWMRDALCHVPFKVIESSHKAWEAPNCCQFTERKISAQISRETLEKIEEYLKKKFEFKDEKSEFVVDHPEESAANIWLEVAEVDDDYRIRMEISDL